MRYSTAPDSTMQPSMQPSEAEITDCLSKESYPYVLVMSPAERSLLEACSKERLAGYKPTLIIDTIKSILECVFVLHTAGVVVSSQAICRCL